MVGKLGWQRVNRTIYAQSRRHTHTQSRPPNVYSEYERASCQVRYVISKPAATAVEPLKTVCKSVSSFSSLPQVLEYSPSIFTDRAFTGMVVRSVMSVRPRVSTLPL